MIKFKSYVSYVKMVGLLGILTVAPASQGSDHDQDGDADLADFAAFQRGFTGAGAPYGDPALGAFDQDFDDDIDLPDLATFAVSMGGVGEPTAGYFIVDEVSAVFVGGVPPDFYARRSIEPGASVVIFGGDVGIVPPRDDLFPFVYGSGNEYAYALYQSTEGFYRAEFNEPGPYFISLGGGSEFVAVLVGMVLQEVGDTCQLEDWDTFTPPIGDLLICDGEDPGGEFVIEYYLSRGANVAVVPHVDSAIGTIRANGPVGSVVFAGHASHGNISVGGGNLLLEGKWFGKDAAGNSLGEYDELVDWLTGIKGYVTDEIWIIGCCPGDIPEGQVFVDGLSWDLRNPLPIIAKAKKGSLSYTKNLLGWYRAWSTGGNLYATDTNH